MAEEVLRTGPHNRMRVLEDTDESLLFEATWQPGSNVPPPHLHPTQAEDFEILEGELEAIVDGEQRTLRAGDTLHLPAAAVHQMWNASDVPARATWRVTPPQRTLELFRKLDSGDIPPDFLQRYASELRIAGG